MKKTLLFYSSCLMVILTGCQENIDKTDPFKVGQAIHEGLSTNDSTLLKSLFVHSMDSLLESTKKNIEEAKQFLAQKSESEILKIDTSSFNVINYRAIDIYYKDGKDFYQISSTYKPDSLGLIEINNLLFTHFNKECDEYKNRPYNPGYLVDFKRIMWSTDYSRKTLESGAVELQNNTELDLNYIKFRVKLSKSNNSYSSETFFNQTVESYKPIYKGDIVKIDVPGMEDYYVGFPVSNENLQWQSEIIEVRPKPASYYCEILSKLQEEVIEKASK